MKGLKKTMAELHRIKQEDYSLYNHDGLILLLDNIRSAYNVGSIFRSADAMGVSAIYLCGITCRIDNREVQKTALGAELSVPSYYEANSLDAIEKLKKQGYIIYALEQTHNSLSLHSKIFDVKTKYAFVLGNEVEGVSEEAIQNCDANIEIPQVGTKHSLNVANTASIVLWEYFKSRNYADTI